MAGETTISDLIKEIRRVELILPEFQRGYVWRSDQVRSYLSSLYRGYPTGSFLIWKTPTPPKVRGEASTDESKSYRLILDGQQRLTSIFVLIEGEPPPFYEGEKLYFNLYFNVLKEEFAYYKKSEMHQKIEWVPVTSFFKQGLASFITSQTDEAKQYYFENFDRLTRLDAIKSYLYYQKELTELEMDRVVEVFNLVNSSGTRLSKSDLALAHICSLWPDARGHFRSVQEVYRNKGFDFDLSFYTRCTAIVATGSALYEPLYKTPIDDVKGAWPKVTKALDYLLNVLRGDAFIDNARTFPSATVVIPLVAYLALAGKPHFDSEVSKRSFLHWMYAAMMWGRYSGSAETKLQADVEALNADDPPAKLRDNLIADRGRIKVEAKDLEGAGVSSPFFPMTYVVARSRGAVDWFNGTQLYQKAIGQSFGLEIHHVFPQARLYGPDSHYDASNATDRRVVNEIANLAYLTKEANLGILDNKPVTYLPKVLAKYPDALKQQAVPQAPGHWEMTQFESFLATRRKLLAESINTFMESLLAKPDSVGFTIYDFIARGEGPQLEFKSSVRWDYKLSIVNKDLEKVVAKTIAGFMNHSGGTLVVGVTDDGEVLGLEPDMVTLKKQSTDGLSLHLTETLNKYLGENAAASVVISFAPIDGKTVGIVSTTPSTQPVFVEDGGSPEFHLRSNASTRLLDVKEATSYIAAHWPGIG